VLDMRVIWQLGCAADAVVALASRAKRAQRVSRAGVRIRGKRSFRVAPADRSRVAKAAAGPAPAGAQKQSFSQRVR